MQPQVAAAELDPLSLAISLSYPIADLLLIGVAMGLLTTPGARTTSFRLLRASLVLLLVADQIYAAAGAGRDVRLRRLDRLAVPRPRTSCSAPPSPTRPCSDSPIRTRSSSRGWGRSA